MTDSTAHKKQSFSFLFWGLLGLVAIFFLAAPLSGWPPNWLERRTQRQQVLERVQSAGGWGALRRDCDALARTYKDDPYGFTWFDNDTNTLPPAIAALHPKQVQSVKFEGSNVVVRISIFGAHATGGHDQPWLGLDVLCESGVASYSPARVRSTTPFRYWRYQKVTDDIYEFY